MQWLLFILRFYSFTILRDFDSQDYGVFDFMHWDYTMGFWTGSLFHNC